MGKTSLFSVLLMLLTFSFVLLKATGYTAVATWSWFWVLSPILIPFGIAAVIFLVVGLIFSVALSNKE